ncbi:TauD/TfdA family dioxygenase [Streptomyces sp. NBC_01340]|uniref:TauD/TfdA family dioxygenase n=1 Tax=unclassified Streptomyces TaxID=2593676 RepID=UPI00225270F5|nr:MULTISPECIES: TauD/TfdA family dioxygenase [unclassified Streptomyces]MCX4455823.1 TauD/TfdA family dioxygenase [Streptomyces sp. NBC_01719]MCX4495183.1 TauD/TfdA family dioxygenase [Streptomyces sp. NBC_01728]WSI40150.1 TauD/TfdA family dioxygenase [Streptomyces sp. NBC_01340]
MTDRNGWSPLEITPGDVGAAATPEALVEHLDSIDLAGLLVREKAVVFRGFKVPGEGLDPVLDRLLPRRLAYVHGNSPRTKVGSNVYTSTEYPQEYTISMHNEMSYAHAWPTRLAFYCAVAPETGGATPVVDAALWLEALDPEVREAFEAGVRYTQNLHGGRGLGKSWQDTFETGDRDEVDVFLKEAEAEWSWGPGNSLKVSQLRHSTMRHPVTGAEVWFNQSDQWHPASLGDDTAKALAQIMPADELPQSVTFADGSPIPDEYVLQVRDRGLENAVNVDWHEGDLLLIDNLLVGHGRRPFTGPRRILVAMSD